MPTASRLSLAKPTIVSFFAAARQTIYFPLQLSKVLRDHRRAWRLAGHTTIENFISFLIKHTDLRAHKFRSEAYQREITRYSWGEASIFELALTLKAHAYLCHATALSLHALAKPDQKMIYVNAEQSSKSFERGLLTQEAIERAFSGKQRQSNLIYKHAGASVVMISGKNTNRLGVEPIAAPASATLPVTNLERTLIDIVVRPAYAGGLDRVLEAYRAARDRVSIQGLVATLRKLDYVYPYHQSIGFLMERAGYPDAACDRLRVLGLDHDFYLAHGIKQPQYSEEWRLYFPKRL